MPNKCSLSRRECIRIAGGAIAAGIVGVNHFDASPLRADDTEGQYGPLKKDPLGILDLPVGFTYDTFSRTGEWMDDGLKVPGAHDGMAAFPGPDGTTILVRNHELSPDQQEVSCHLLDSKLTQKIDRSRVYDWGRNRRPAVGGTTTLVYDVRQKKLVKHFMSLLGTSRNCAGGPTPWKTWLTCEETVDRAGDLIERDHGYVFEVPATTRVGMARPVAYKAMGRFNHEAVAVDSRTGIVYLTEDRDDGLIYRFLPDRPAQLSKGGTLQALRLKGTRQTKLRNWPGERQIPIRRPLDVEWVEVENIESPGDDLRYQGSAEKQAAVFARGEGMWYEKGMVYWACTNGGPNQKGQVFRYLPSPEEGNSGEESQPGQLEILSQPNDAGLLQMADNLTVAPWGDVIICEDGGPVNRFVGITPAGRIYTLARNALDESEFAGSTFSPDGSTLFVNLQKPGISLAITGPWRSIQAAS